ncbi:hypothetical protein [Desulfurobacterium sp.]
MKKVIIFIMTFSFCLLFSTTAMSATGWIKKEKKGYIYFKPFVTVKSPDVIVIFITPKGKVYRGTCKKRNFINACIVTPRKQFDSHYTALKYIVLKISPPKAPEILKTGIVKETVKGE